MRFVKYFTFFRLSFRLLFCLIIYFIFAFCLHLSYIKIVGKRQKMRIWSLKIGGLSGKNATKAKNAFFHFLCRLWATRSTKVAFWAQNWAKRAKKTHFSYNLKNLHIKLKINTLQKQGCDFCKNPLHFVCICKTFFEVLLTWLSDSFNPLLRFCNFACKNFMSGNRLYNNIYINISQYYSLI